MAIILSVIYAVTPMSSSDNVGLLVRPVLYGVGTCILSLFLSIICSVFAFTKKVEEKNSEFSIYALLSILLLPLMIGGINIILSFATIWITVMLMYQ